jgi:hypothetical protein
MSKFDFTDSVGAAWTYLSCAKLFEICCCPYCASSRQYNYSVKGDRSGRYYCVSASLHCAGDLLVKAVATAFLYQIKIENETQGQNLVYSLIPICVVSPFLLENQISATRAALRKKYGLTSKDTLLVPSMLCIRCCLPFVLAQHEMQLYRKGSAWYAGEARKVARSVTRSIERME